VSDDADGRTGDGRGGDDRASGGRAGDHGDDRPAIRRLDPTTVERIAAGEVVERPASVVKELVENALDADATRIRVAVERGGTGRVRVTDDGLGMSESEVRTAVEKHTTSKISSVADLDAGVESLGFRGEALSAIGAVSRLVIRTKPRGSDRGTELRMAGGEVEAIEAAGCPAGTVVEVADVFYNVPARRKYLAQVGTEFAHINRVTAGYALANPEVAVTLEHDDRETFSTAGQGDLKGTVMAVYGREVAEAMVPVVATAREGDTNGDGANGSDSPAGGVSASPTDLPEGPLSAVRGVISHPETTRAGPEYVSTYVNGRYVRAKTVRDAAIDAYGTQLAPDRYPFAVLLLSLPGGAVDVNVHPRKHEVRFADEAGVREQVGTAVERALLDAGLLRSSAPRGRSAPDQTDVNPGREADPEPRRDGSDGSDGTDAAERAETAHTAETAANRTGTEDGGSPEAPITDDGGEDGTAGSGSPPATDDGPDGPREATARLDRPGDAANATAERRAGDRPATAHEPNGHVAESDATDADPSQRFTGPVEQATLDGESLDREERLDRLPPLRVLGQLHDSYVVAESPEGVVLIDQHAADERVNYERLRERFAGGSRIQELAEPVGIALTAEEAALFGEYEGALARLGFRASLVDEGDEDASDGRIDGERSGERTDVERVDDGTGGERAVRVTAVPSLLANAADPKLLRDALSTVVAGRSGTATVAAAADTLLADLACYPSITGNTPLSEGSVVDLLAALDACENPYACPHGRPVLIEVSAGELAERFERDYPGHAGRRE
jgi:DNA mismatch repair protein MutL